VWEAWTLLIRQGKDRGDRGTGWWWQRQQQVEEFSREGKRIHEAVARVGMMLNQLNRVNRQGYRGRILVYIDNSIVIV
jgi:hypothetical protein